MNIKCLPLKTVVAILLVPLPLILSMGFSRAIPGRIGSGGKHKASFMPVVWAFGATWTTIYIMQGVALSLLYLKRSFSDMDTKIAFIIFALQMLLNLAFIVVSKLIQSMYWNAVVVLAIQIIVPVNMIYFYRMRPVCGALFIPNSFWSVVATALSIENIRLNS